MKKTALLKIAGAASAAAALLAGPALAHHSAAMFDRTKQVDLKGVVKEFQWTNPHSWIQVNVQGANGQTEEWSVEGGSPNTLARSGWRPSTFKPGDRVTVRISPMKDGSKAGLFVGAVTADGKTLGRMGEAGQPAN